MPMTDQNPRPTRVPPVDTTPFDPFELPDTLQLGSVEDPYPFLAAARRRGPVQTEWPFVDALVHIDDAPEAGVNVLGYDEAAAVLRDHETDTSEIVAAVMGEVLGPAMTAMYEPEH